jgi:glutathione S-transferase
MANTALCSELKPLLMFNHVGMHMPNIWKICFLVKELGLKCDMKFLDFYKNEQKQSPHIGYNPNGRIPTLVDGNNDDFPVWESNAILMYLMERYDSENKTGFMGTTPDEKAQVIQWLFFQASGQGMKPNIPQTSHLTFDQVPTMAKPIGSYTFTPKRSHRPSAATRMRSCES